MNGLERDEDPQGTWREYVNSRLQADYHGLYDLIDIWVMLQAPSFNSIFRWRLEQEQKLADRQTGPGNQVMSAQQIAQAHYAAQLEWYSYYRGRHGERTGFATPPASWQWPAPLRAD